MTLTARLLVFSLATLGAVLVGYSAGLYLFVRADLHRQAGGRLSAGIDALAAAIEYDEDGKEPGLEWEPRGRVPTFPVHLIAGEGHDFEWATTSPDGRVLDATRDGWTTELLAAADGRESSRPRRVTHAGRPWLVRRRVYTDSPVTPGPLKPGRYSEITVTAALSLDPVTAALRRLAATLASLSAAVWVTALLLGRRVCRRALRPLTVMAAAARNSTADGRLPVGPAADELTDLGRAFNGLLDRLGVAHERQRRFTGEASHQLRTPLAAVLGQVEVALRRERPADEYRRVLATVHGQAERMRKLVEALLLLARADEDAGPPARERIDLAAWLPAHLRAWDDHPRAGDLRAEGAGPAWAEVHPVLFGELLNNLIDNALKYSPAGSPVRVRVGADPAHAWVEVIDTGPGIAAADQAHLFRPFFRADAARRQGAAGMGLGLAIAARLAALMGGAIGGESGPAGGSAFTVRLPAVGAG